MRTWYIPNYSHWLGAGIITAAAGALNLIFAVYEHISTWSFDPNAVGMSASDTGKALLIYVILLVLNYVFYYYCQWCNKKQETK